MKVADSAPVAPDDLKEKGRRLWTAVMAEFELRQHESDLLHQACIALDRLEELNSVIRRDGLGIGERVHPAVTEARMTGILFARLLASLRLPEADDDEHELLRRPQRRVGIRGVYRRRHGPRLSVVPR